MPQKPLRRSADALRLNLHADVGNPYSGFVNIGEKEGAGIVRR
jgi:hypothetical protein